MAAKKLALLVSLLTLALPRTSGLALGAPRLSVYPPVPGLAPSPYYGLRVREASLFFFMVGKRFITTISMIYGWQSDNHYHNHQQRQNIFGQIMVIIIIIIIFNHGGKKNLDQMIIARLVKKAGKTYSHCWLNAQRRPSVTQLASMTTSSSSPFGKTWQVFTLKTQGLEQHVCEPSSWWRSQNWAGGYHHHLHAHHDHDHHESPPGSWCDTCIDLHPGDPTMGRANDKECCCPPRSV